MNENVVAFDTSNGMLNGNACAADGLIISFLRWGQGRLRIVLTLARLFVRHENVGADVIGTEAQVPKSTSTVSAVNQS
ncbi:MAG: hypothetical protein UZ22_OP11002000363 [Microgenomates bacterium OLB23]|nr:MAG: hypothetical protein UZ22_OP11002000363 [Microgenomates bacterium OLB23]